MWILGARTAELILLAKKIVNAGICSCSIEACQRHVNCYLNMRSKHGTRIILAKRRHKHVLSDCINTTMLQRCFKVKIQSISLSSPKVHFYSFGIVSTGCKRLAQNPHLSPQLKSSVMYAIWYYVFCGKSQCISCLALQRMFTPMLQCCSDHAKAVWNRMFTGKCRIFHSF